MNGTPFRTERIASGEGLISPTEWAENVGRIVQAKRACEPLTKEGSGAVIVGQGGAAVAFAQHLPFALIAGPCAMESRDHALEIASAIKEIANALHLGFVFKTSFDKANRTSGASARGLGMKQALPVFAEIRETLGVAVTTDVHETI